MMNSKQGRKNGEEEKKKKKAGIMILFVLLSFSFVTACLIGVALESSQPSEHTRSWTNDQIAEHAGKPDKCITKVTERVLTYWDRDGNIYTDGLTTDVLAALMTGGKNPAGKTCDQLGLPQPSLGDIIWAADEQEKATPYCVGAAPTVSITTDKITYTTSDTMTITIDSANPTEDSVTFQWYWVVPQFSVCIPVMSSSIPAGYEDTLDFRFTIPNWGSTPFGNVFYVQLLDADGEVLDADVIWWAYSPIGEAMPAREVDIAKEIKKTIEEIR